MNKVHKKKKSKKIPLYKKNFPPFLRPYVTAQKMITKVHACTAPPVFVLPYKENKIKNLPLMSLFTGKQTLL